MFKKIIQFKLRFLASLIIKRYQPRVVAVSGSVGKTSTREAIAAVLSSRFKVRQNLKNYNNEIGLPLTIIGAESPGKNIWGWLAVAAKAGRLLAFKAADFPQFLVLELGIDQPGDMAYLTSIVRPEIAVLTGVGQSHLEHFGSEDALAREKWLLAQRCLPGGFVVFNADDDKLWKLSRQAKSRLLPFGCGERAEVRALESSFSAAPAGTAYKLKYQGSFVPVHLAALGKPAVYASLAAASVALALGFNLVEISKALEFYRAPKGRLKPLDGCQGLFLIDDTYNASPQSVLAGLELAGNFKLSKGAWRLAVLGDMLELGNYTVDGHRSVGEAVARQGFTHLVAVGEQSVLIASAAQDAGLDKVNIKHFANSSVAAEYLATLNPPKGSLALVKGSQGMRMERAVRALLARPEEASDFLVRQDWPDAVLTDTDK